MGIINDFDYLTTMLQKAMRLENRFKYSVPRLGQVKQVDDQNQTGRILVICDSLGWSTESQGVWAYPKDVRRLITPKKDDYVIIEWIDGNRDKPVIYSSIAYWMKDMLPKNYDGASTTQVLYEDNNKELSIVYDENTKELKVIQEKQKYDIILNDTEIDINYGDVNINIDKNTKKMSITGDGIDMLGASESFVKGDTCKAELEKDQTLMQTLQSSMSGWVPVPNDGGAALKAALSAFFALAQANYSNILSTKIKGE
jgi:phage baseplate assembly protein gpV